MHATIYFDGASRGNPGPMGAGAVIEAGSKKKVVRRAVGRGTNNEAEYHAVIAALEEALCMGATTVAVHGDSELVLRQLKGEYRVRKPHLKPLHDQATRLLAQFERTHLQWVPRAENEAADRAANEALDGVR